MLCEEPLRLFFVIDYMYTLCSTTVFIMSYRTHAGLGQYAQITPQQAQNLLKQLASGVSSSAGGLSLSPQRAQLQQVYKTASVF